MNTQTRLVIAWGITCLILTGACSSTGRGCANQKQARSRSDKQANNNTNSIHKKTKLFQGRMHVVTIAISDYSGTGLDDLPQTQHDAIGLRAVLQRYVASKGVRIVYHTLLGQKKPKKRVGVQKPKTRVGIEQVRELFRSLTKQVRKSDTVLVLFSGHGKAAKVEGEPINILALQDYRKADIIKLHNGTYGRKAFFTAQELNQKLSELDSKSTIAFLDACQSGALRGSGRQTNMRLIGAFRSTGHAAIASARSSQNAVAGINKTFPGVINKQGEPIRGYGSLVYALMEAISGKVRDTTGLQRQEPDQIIDHLELFRYLMFRTKALAAGEGKLQEPVASGAQASPIPLWPTNQSNKPQKATLLINSTPPGANVYIDGVNEGSTNFTGSFTPGIKTILLRKKGYHPWQEKLRLRPGHTRTRHIELQPKQGGEFPGKRAGTVVSIKGLPEAKAIYIPKGSFMMGSPTSETGRSKDEVQHRVTLSHGFWMMQTEVTQHQFQTIMGYNPSYFKNCGRNCPVEMVTWHEAVLFANKLSQKAGLGRGCFACSGTGKSPKCQAHNHRIYGRCKGWKLPTEAQWEYAARAGTTTARYGNLNDIAWWGAYSGGNSPKSTNPVKGKLPNQWKLYDILGNVYEWTYDYYANYSFGAVLDPVGPDAGSIRVLRGGGWSGGARYARTADRFYYSPDNRNAYLGFRLVRNEQPMRKSLTTR